MEIMASSHVSDGIILRKCKAETFIQRHIVDILNDIFVTQVMESLVQTLISFLWMKLLEAEKIPRNIF